MPTASNRNRAQTTLRLPAALMDALQKEAAERGISFNAYVLCLIDRGRRAEREFPREPIRNP